MNYIRNHDRLGYIFLMALLFAVVMSLVWWASSASPCGNVANAQTAGCPVGSTAVFEQDIGIQAGTTSTITVSGTPTADRTIELPDASTKLVGVENRYGAVFVVCASDAINTGDCDYNADGTADDVQIQAAIDLAEASHSAPVYLSDGTFNITSTIDCGASTRVNVIGAGRAATVIESTVAGPAFEITARGGCNFQGFKIDVNSTGSGVGINVTKSPHNMKWDDMEIVFAPDAGLRITASDADATTFTAYNNFGTMWISNSGQCVDLVTSGAGQINSNTWEFLYANTCTTALDLDDDVNGTSIKHFNAEANTTAISIDGGNNKGLYIFGGWFEGNTTDCDVANEPSWGGQLVILAHTDNVSDLCTYTYDNNRADLFPSANGKFLELKGRWHFDDMRQESVGSGIYDVDLNGARWGNATASDGDTTPTVNEINILFLNNTAPTTITDFDDQTSWQHLIVVTNNGNATIADSGNFRLATSWAPDSVGDSITLHYNASLSAWVETSRSDN